MWSVLSCVVLPGEFPVIEPQREVRLQESTTHVPSQLRTTLEATMVQQHQAPAAAEEGFFAAEGDLEPHDYTYWDKLRRKGTRTEIRRWRTFAPEAQQDTPFMGRNLGTSRIFSLFLRCLHVCAYPAWRATTSASTAR